MEARIIDYFGTYCIEATKFTKVDLGTISALDSKFYDLVNWANAVIGRPLFKKGGMYKGIIYYYTSTNQSITLEDLTKLSKYLGDKLSITACANSSDTYCMIQFYSNINN